MTSPLEHKPPYGTKAEATFFVTICAHERDANTLCLPEIGKIVLDSIRWRNERHIWFCEIALLMPDHVHLILKFSERVAMTKALRDWKSWLTKTHGISWQENFFDHRLREDEAYDQKAAYILQNPVRAKLIAKEEDWPYVWISSDKAPASSRRRLPA